MPDDGNLHAYFGGTFDPVHNGHLHAARSAQDALGLSCLHLVLAARPVHRQPPQASAEDRWAMLQLAVAGTTTLVAEDLELRRPGPSYTVDTLTELRQRHGQGASLVWLLGWDAFCTLDQWRDWQRILQLAHLVILRRPGAAPDLSDSLQMELSNREIGAVTALSEQPAGRILTLPAPMELVSASEVRIRLAEGANASDLLPFAVWSYINEHRLYRKVTPTQC